MFRADPVPFKQQDGEKDAMGWFNYHDHSAWPIQEAPIYGIEYDKEDKNRRFLTIRRSDRAIVKYSNNWIVGFASSGRWRLKCPKNMLMMGTSCRTGICDDLNLQCGKVGVQFQMISSKKKVVRPKNAESSVYCPDGMYAQGIECVGKGCKNPGLSCVQLNFDKLSVNQVPFSTAAHRTYASAVFSSDGHGHSWFMGGPIYAIGCLGKTDCESKQLYAVVRGIGPMVAVKLTWRGPASDVGTSVTCPKNMVIFQMGCSGNSCSSITIGCAPFKDSYTYRVMHAEVRKSNTFSTLWPHQAVGTCPDGHFANSIDCVRESCSALVIGCVKVAIRQ